VHADPAENCLVTTVRCPSCDAALPDSAEWCSLCYAKLRTPEPVASGAVSWAQLPGDSIDAPAMPAASSPVIHPATTIEAPTGVVGATLDPLTAPLHVLLAPTPGAAEAPPSAPAAEQPALTWPCTACGASNPMALDACEACGAPFLDGGDGVSVTLPVVGDLRSLSTSGRLVTGIAVGLGLAVLIVLLLTVFGLIF
jgi:hypothetical protein